MYAIWALGATLFKVGNPQLRLREKKNVLDYSHFYWKCFYINEWNHRVIHEVPSLGIHSRKNFT